MNININLNALHQRMINQLLTYNQTQFDIYINNLTRDGCPEPLLTEIMNVYRSMRLQERSLRHRLNEEWERSRRESERKRILEIEEDEGLFHLR